MSFAKAFAAFGGGGGGNDSDPKHSPKTHPHKGESTAPPPLESPPSPQKASPLIAATPSPSSAPPPSSAAPLPPPAGKGTTLPGHGGPSAAGAAATNSNAPAMTAAASPPTAKATSIPHTDHVVDNGPALTSALPHHSHQPLSEREQALVTLCVAQEQEIMLLRRALFRDAQTHNDGLQQQQHRQQGAASVGGGARTTALTAKPTSGASSTATTRGHPGPVPLDDISDPAVLRARVRSLADLADRLYTMVANQRSEARSLQYDRVQMHEQQQQQLQARRQQEVAGSGGYQVFGQDPTNLLHEGRGEEEREMLGGEALGLQSPHRVGGGRGGADTTLPVPRVIGVSSLPPSVRALLEAPLRHHVKANTNDTISSSSTNHVTASAAPPPPAATGLRGVTYLGAAATGPRPTAAPSSSSSRSLYRHLSSGPEATTAAAAAAAMASRPAASATQWAAGQAPRLTQNAYHNNVREQHTPTSASIVNRNSGVNLNDSSASNYYATFLEAVVGPNTFTESAERSKAMRGALSADPVARRGGERGDGVAGSVWTGARPSAAAAGMTFHSDGDGDDHGIGGGHERGGDLYDPSANASRSHNNNHQQNLLHFTSDPLLRSAPTMASARALPPYNPSPFGTSGLMLRDGGREFQRPHYLASR